MNCYFAVSLADTPNHITYVDKKCCHHYVAYITCARCKKNKMTINKFKSFLKIQKTEG